MRRTNVCGTFFSCRHHLQVENCLFLFLSLSSFCFLVGFIPLYSHIIPLTCSMDVLNVGFPTDASVLLSATSQEEEELLAAGFQGIQSLTFSLHSPSEYSNESGETSPGTLLDDDLFDGLLGTEDHLLLCNSELSLAKENPPTPKVATITPAPLSPPVALPKATSPKPVANMHEPKVKLYQDGQKLSNGQIERNRKNAIAARANRQKKKEYMNGLEEQVDSLKSENKTLSERCKELEGTVSDLEQEVVYLKSVLANQSSLSSILRGLPDVKGVSIKSPFITTGNKRRRMDAEDGSDTKKVMSDLPGASGGICLHIAGEVASLELCPQCSLAAGKRKRPLSLLQ